LRGNDVPSTLAIQTPGYQSLLLAYILGDGDFPSINTSTFLDWQCVFVEGGYLRRYVDQLRERRRTRPHWTVGDLSAVPAQAVRDGFGLGGFSRSVQGPCP
jgi:hypothetical protein